MDKALVVFQGKNIRRVWHHEEWWFSVIDIVTVLTEQENFQTARKYWNKLSQRLREEGSEVVTNCHQLKLPAVDGKYYETDCANTETLFRIIQSIPSQKAEPFKQWLALVGYERVQEIENPELAQERMKQLYERKGYSKEWIEKRLRGIAIRQELTDVLKNRRRFLGPQKCRTFLREWKQRGVDENVEFAILTNDISKATFGKTVDEYKEFKGLQKQNLRDHMNDLELIFTMLGEKVTTEITRKDDAHGFGQNKDAALKGGTIAGNARKETEKELGKPVATAENYLREPEKRKRLK